jgi:hypothetical protein
VVQNSVTVNREGLLGSTTVYVMVVVMGAIASVLVKFPNPALVGNGGIMGLPP